MNREREEHRDERLGAALRELPVPEHRRGFWDDLAEALADSDGPGAIRLDEQRARRRRRAVPFAVAAAAVLVLGTAALLATRAGDVDRGRDVTVAGPPGSGEGRVAAPLVVTATYEETSLHAGDRTWRLVAAADGSYRWSLADGTLDYAYDAETGEATELTLPADPSSGPKAAYVSIGVAPGGPSVGILRPDPVGTMADFITALGRTGDERVSTVHPYDGRPAWLYDGPIAADRLGGGDSPDRAAASVDQETGVLLGLRLTTRGEPYRELQATAVEVGDRVDRAVFRIDPPAGVETTRVSLGARRVAPEDLAEMVDFDVLVPRSVPEGFRLAAATVNTDVGRPTGPEGMNPPVTDVVTLTWRDGFHAFTVTLRPTSGAPWDDPFGMEGFVLAAEPVRFDLPGRAPLTGMLVVDPPDRPHVWGVTGDLVVTVDGDLGAKELAAVAASLEPR